MIRGYFEDVYLATPGMLGHTTFNMECVEFLKGTQGTLRAWSSTANVIKLNTPEPTREMVHGLNSVERSNTLEAVAEAPDLPYRGFAVTV